MLRFLYRWLGFLLIQALLMGSALWFAHAFLRQHYLYAIVDKHDHLSASPGPRLIVAGGSSAAFGIHAEQLAHLLGRQGTNLALHADFKRDFMLAELERVLRPGDLALLSLEYENYAAPRQITTELWTAILSRPQSLVDFRTTDPRLVLDGLTLLTHYAAQVAVNGFLNGAHPGEGVYKRSSFNRFGDLLGQARYETTRPLPASRDSIVFDEDEVSDTLNLIAQLIQRAASIDARVYLVFPPLYERAFELQQAKITKIVGMAQSNLGETVTVGQLRDIPRPEEDFFDTEYHLLEAAAQAHTERLLRQLQLRDANGLAAQ